MKQGRTQESIAPIPDDNWLNFHVNIKLSSAPPPQASELPILPPQNQFRFLFRLRLLAAKEERLHLSLAEKKYIIKLIQLND